VHVEGAPGARVVLRLPLARCERRGDGVGHFNFRDDGRALLFVCFAAEKKNTGNVSDVNELTVSSRDGKKNNQKKRSDVGSQEEEQKRRRGVSDSCNKEKKTRNKKNQGAT
jgi:hypothetical protein